MAAAVPRLESSASVPTLGLPSRGLSRSSSHSASGLSGRSQDISSRSSTSVAEPRHLMPAYYSSHKALHRVLGSSPHLFSGHGARLSSSQEKFFPVDNRGKGVASLAYRRRQLLTPEAEVLRSSHCADPRSSPKHAGAALQAIHKDMR